MKCQVVLYAGSGRRVKTKPVEFSSSGANVLKEALTQINILFMLSVLEGDFFSNLNSKLDRRTEILLQHTNVAVAS